MESDQANLTLACGLESARMAVTQSVIQKPRVLGARHKSDRPEATRQAIGHATLGASSAADPHRRVLVEARASLIVEMMGSRGVHSMTGNRPQAGSRRQITCQQRQRVVIKNVCDRGKRLYTNGALEAVAHHKRAKAADWASTRCLRIA